MPPNSSQGAPTQRSYYMTPSSGSATSFSTSSSYTSPDYSYFSPYAPLTSPSSAPINANSTSANTGLTYTTQSATPGGPTITSSVTRAGGRGYISDFGSARPHSQYGHSTRGSYPVHTIASDVLQQFALHIPPPPPLSLSLSAIRNAGAVSTSSPASTSTSTPCSASAPASAYPHSIHHSQPPQMTISSTQEKYTLSVMLPRSIPPEMVTISANKGDRIRVVADAIGGEECHYEWQISFPPHDIDMSAVHARFDPDGRLTLEVKRRSRMYY